MNVLDWCCALAIAVGVGVSVVACICLVWEGRDDG